MVGKVSVLALHRDVHGVPGVPPISSTGKTEMAFDLGNGIEPGALQGNSLLNAHTWPDGSALGNRLLAELNAGAKIIVRGVLGQICYQVSDRVEVPFDDPGIRYFATAGPPQIAIIVCSGKRVGPGEWTKRTIWYASPMI
ncbi:MAG TPA: class F sortase [Sporichthyaceae bacterium]|nr:class F sortase [Sporichthyaceae bacterium]